jgi:hypothetical protein
MDVDHLHSGKLLEHRSGSESGGQIAEAAAQGHVQAVGQKRDEDVSFDAPFELVEDRADAQVALEVLEGLLDLNEFDVEFPELPGSSWQRLERSR